MSYENMHKKAERLARERIEMENRKLVGFCLYVFHGRQKKLSIFHLQYTQLFL